MTDSSLRSQTAPDGVAGDAGGLGPDSVGSGAGPQPGGDTAVDHEWIIKLNPADDTEVVRFRQSTTSDIEAAVNRARAATSGWARTTPADRAAAVAAVADLVGASAGELAGLVNREMGRPVDEALEGVHAGVATLRQYSELGPLHRGRALAGDWSTTDLMVNEPRGVAAVITPWNDPVAVSCGLLGAALVTGNTVVYKPSERTPATGQLLGELFARALPAGVLVTLAGGPAVGAVLAAAPVDLVAHVGSTATGRAIAATAAVSGAKVLLENGGNDPLIVDADVDPAWAAGQAALGAFTNAGQLCVAVERIYVHRSVAEAFLSELVLAAKAMTVAPLVDRRLRDTVHAQVSEAVGAGASVLTGGQPGDGPGAYYPATVLGDCADDMTVMREETFGPVAPVAVVDSFDEALRRAADSRYGLAATVLTGSMAHAQRAWRELPVGTVKINSVFGGAPGGAAHPRRGSGEGYGYGPELMDEFTATKVVHVSVPPAS
jgi:acyl-CoA reductase-like NAD-dependent aldehyde dehydrogenase